MTQSLLCETVTGQSMAELLANRDAASAGDMVELRLDGVQDLDVERALHGRKRPAVVTIRPAWEGGRFTGDEDSRRRLLLRALACGVEYVDVEWKAGFTDIVAHAPQRVVLSSHDFSGMPPDVNDRARAMRATGAGLIKIAVTPSRLSETLPLVDIAAPGDAVVIGMGDMGLPTRLLASRFGSRWSYAGSLAPGQMTAQRMLEQYRFRAVGPTTRIYGVVGANAGHSRSPQMHNAAFAAAGMDAVYVPLRPSDFADFLTFAAAMDIAGVSVTIPFKLDALRSAAAADPLTRAVGAANTLRRTTAGWEATNTDVAGFLAPLETIFGGALQGVRAAVLGAGGAARAVVVALTSRGAAVTVHARRPEQARDVAGLGAAPAVLPPAAGSWDLLVNATPLGGGTLRDESPLPGGPFTGRVVYDLTYGAGDSRLVREARAAGCVTLDGLPMLVAQAEQQFQWWTGRVAPAGVMARASGVYASHNV